MKLLLALLVALPLSLRGETISDFEKKFDVVATCGTDAVAVVSAKKFQSLFDKPKWKVDELADYIKLNQVGSIGLKLQTNTLEDDGIKLAQALYAKSGAHVTLYAYRKKEVAVIKDLEPKARDEAKPRAEEPKAEAPKPDAPNAEEPKKD
jgi:hypothetical protein